MFSYSKRLALLLTVCGTLLNTSPLLAATEGEGATKQSSKSSWFSWLGFKKKDKKPKESPDSLQEQVKENLRHIAKLTKESEEEKKRLEDLARKETNPKAQNKITQDRLKTVNTLEELEKWQTKLTGHQRRFGYQTPLSADEAATIKQDIKKSSKFIGSTYGLTRRLFSGTKKKLGLKKPPPSNASLQQNLSGAIQKHMQDLNTLSGELNANSEKISEQLPKTSDPTKQAKLEKAQEDITVHRNTLEDFHKLMKKDEAKLQQSDASQHLTSIQEDVAEVDEYIKELKGKRRRFKEWAQTAWSKQPPAAQTPAAVGTPTITLTPADN